MSDSLAQAIVGGLLALLGGFLGAWLTRRTEYEKWLRQQRSVEFAAFLRRLFEIRREASNAIYSTEGDAQTRNMNATELFSGLQKYESVARLYMSSAGRKELSVLTNKLWVDCTMEGGPANRSVQIKQTESAIQELIEHELEYLPWQIRWKR